MIHKFGLASCYLLSTVQIKREGAVCTYAHDATEACLLRTVMKGDLPATGARDGLADGGQVETRDPTWSSEAYVISKTRDFSNNF